MAGDENLKSCAACGATIYPEHIASGRAAMVGGKLLCQYCINEQKSQTGSASSPGSSTAGRTAVHPAVASGRTASQPAVHSGLTAAGKTAVQPAVQNNQSTAGKTAVQPAIQNNQSAAGRTAVQPAIQDEEPVSLVDESEVGQGGRTITAFARERTKIVDESKLHRSLQKTGAGATRIKVFHTKMNDGAVEFMCQSINEWVDANPEVEIKTVQTTVGVWEGKHPEPHLILTVWY